MSPDIASRHDDAIPRAAGTTVEVGWFTVVGPPGVRRSARRSARRGHTSAVHLLDAENAAAVRRLGPRAGRRDILTAYTRITGERRLSALCGVPVPPHAFVPTRAGDPDLSGDTCQRCADH